MKLYHVWLVNDRIGVEVQMSGYPMPHGEACAFRRAMMTLPGRRYELREVLR